MNEPPTIVPPSAQQHTHTVVFLHGRGDSVRNFIDNTLLKLRDSQNRTLADFMPSFRWVFPQAPARQLASCSSMRMPQWFDVWNTNDFADREELQAEGLREVVPEICKILRTEAEMLGSLDTPAWERVILMGISMGAATSAHVLFNLDAPRLGAFVGFSCRCPFSGRDLVGMRNVLALDGVPTHDQVLRNTPILLEHCIDDPLVLVQSGRLMTETLKRFGANVERREYPSGGHWFNSPAGMDDVITFLSWVLSPHRAA